MTNGLPEELVRSLQRKRVKLNPVWRPLNTYGLYFIGASVIVVLTFTLINLG